MSEAPKRSFVARFHLKPITWFLIIVVVIYLAGQLTEANLLAFFNGHAIQQFGVIFGRMLHPEWSYFPQVIEPILETVRMALVGTLVGSILAIPVAMLQASNVDKIPVLRTVVRILSNLVRTLPDLLMAAIFVAVFGIGPFAGVLTLVIFSFGQMAKLSYEAIETVDPGPIDALETAGANKVQVISFAIVPQVLNTFISNFLYTFEVNVRASTVLGWVGAGGVGQLLDSSLRFTNYERAAVIILAILVVVIIIEVISNYLRGKLA
ncbi:MAG: phosphonate ABC transporter, permease protein PhnE [Lactobacillaceae bacterium]|jgi:phosphonate transport system permease protein|nr:phosphonate ABC transporter, permease protein PhnE [Lactobacillaceae bacterium]